MAARTWAKRVAGGVFLLGLAVGGYCAANWTALKAGAAARQLTRAESDADRDAAAVALVAAGDEGRPAILEVLRGDSEHACHAVAAAAANGGALPTLYPLASTFSPAGVAALLMHLPETFDPATRELVIAGLRSDSESANLNAVRAALRPGSDVLAQVPQLFGSRHSTVRAAAVLAVGMSPSVNDEDLFRLLHDGDSLVRTRSEAALKARGRSSDEVACGKKLVSPVAADRLKLLTDLQYADESLKDISPWLERLAADADPAVRAGAARVAVECRLPFAAWVGKMASHDPDPAVRRIAGFYRLKAADPQFAPADFRR